MITEAINRYHDLITDTVAAETYGVMNEELRKRRCYFGDRPLCTVLRPNFFEPQDWNYLKAETEVLLGAFRKAHHFAMANAAFRAQLDLESYEEQLFMLDIGFEVPWTTSRLDSFFDIEQGSLRFVEYNAETPAGMAYEDQIADVFLNLEIMRRFNEDYEIRSFHVSQGLIASMLEIYRQAGKRDLPQIAIVDWGDVPTLNEHMICQELFEREGIRTILADPRGLEYRHGHLWAGDFRIDLIYKRVLCSELIHRMGMDNAIVHALKNRDVVMSNAFSAKLLAKKASFVLLSDENNNYLFDDEERRVIEEHIPWTRRVQERKTHFHGDEVDLLPFISQNRDNLVLKPNDEYGGKGVLIGWETSQDLWDQTLLQAMHMPYVVQERVHIAYQDFPSYVDSQLLIDPRLVDTDPFIFYGRTTSGTMARLSRSTLLNVTAGGGSITPTFIVQKRS